MKKTLLIAVAAVMVALGANAQFARVAQKVKGYSYQNDLKLENVMTKEYQAPVSKNLTAHRAASTLDGEYILNADNFEGDFTESTTFTLTSQTGTITLDMYDGAPSFNYNVVLNDFSYAGAVVYGKYDAEQGIIEIPVQTIYTHATYKEIVISGGYRKGETNVGYGKEIYLIVNEDGTMDIDEDVEEEGDEATSGWVSFLPNYEEGGLWNYGFDIAVMKPNATMTYDTTSKAMGGTGSGWSEVEKRVYVEDYGSEWVVSNFLGLCPVSVTMNENNKCAIALGVKMYDYDQDEPYGMFRLVGVSSAGEGYIGRNYDKQFLNGFWEPGYAQFFKIIETEEGKKIDQEDDDYYPSVAVATANDADGAAYQLGYAFGIAIETDDHGTTGISETKANCQKTTGKAFNLMGQEVYGNAKGLIIRDGKKLINK